jgi:hypothetical protein
MRAAPWRVAASWKVSDTTARIVSLPFGNDDAASPPEMPMQSPGKQLLRHRCLVEIK